MKRALLAALCAALLAAPAHGQGVQTGTITGTITTPDGLSLPGATATASAPELQGVRTAVSDVNGVYLLRGLPAGTYTLSFEMPDMQPARRDPWRVAQVKAWCPPIEPPTTASSWLMPSLSSRRRCTSTMSPTVIVGKLRP